MNKRRWSLLALLVLFVVYYLATDPDTNVFKDLPFGAPLILTLNIFIITIVGIILIEFVPDYFIDVIYGKEVELRKTAERTADGAGRVMIAKSIRMLGYCIVLAAAIVAYSIG